MNSSTVPEVRITPVSEDGIMVYLGDSAEPAISTLVQAATRSIEMAFGDILIDLVPSYASVLVLYDPLQLDHLGASRRVRGALAQLPGTESANGKTVTLPVYYAPEAGPDLEALANRAELGVEEVIELHAAVEYRVYAIGFAPGFAYLGQVDGRIAAPRLPSPRASVPRGAVGIADRQTAVYPAASPGGWNLIGRCPLHLFKPREVPPMPFAVGDRVRFEPISRQRYRELGGELA